MAVVNSNCPRVSPQLYDAVQPLRSSELGGQRRSYVSRAQGQDPRHGRVQDLHPADKAAGKAANHP